MVKSANGVTNLNPDSFTVRLVETVWVYAGWLGPDTVIDIGTSTNVAAGMFATVTVHDNYYVYGYPNWQSYVSNHIYPEAYPMAVPIVEVYNGFIRLRGQPFEGSYSHGYVVISIMSYI